MARTLSKTGGRAASLRHIPPKLALCVGKPSGDAPKRWRWRELTSLARLESGHTPARKHPEYWEGDLPWISIKDAKANHGGMVQDTAEKTNALGIANSSARLLPKNTVCLSRTASVGYVIRSGSEMATSQDFVNWVCGDELSPEFLQYLLIAEGKDILRFASGAVHQTIYYPEAKGFWVCIPPIAEQEEIVEVLDKAFAAIDQAKANIEQNIANAKELFQSKLNQIFSKKGEGWVETKLEEVCDFQNGFAFKSSKFRESGVPILRISNIQNEEIDLRKIVYAKPEDYDERLDRYLVIKGDLLIAMSGATTGKIGVNNTDTNYYLNQRVGKFEPRRELRKYFLYYFLLTKVEESLSMSAGSAQPNLSTSQIKSFELPLPSLEEQDAIVKKLDLLRGNSQQLESHYQTKLASLDELKKSILQKAFAGELT